jgi:hypothetical protein
VDGRDSKLNGSSRHRRLINGLADMNILIIESTSKTKPLAEDYSDTSIVHCRNSLILKNELNADLLDGEYGIPKAMDKNYDVIICCYASPYMPHNEYRKVLDNNPKARLIWLVNDHDLEDNQLLRYAITERGRSYDMICNNPRNGYRHWILSKNIAEKKLNDFINNWHTCNLNCLIFRNDTQIKKDLIQTDRSGTIYYGTYRKHRCDDFKNYLHQGITISASIKHWTKFKALECTSNCIKPLKWEVGMEGLRNYKYSLYIEDKHTHENYAFMANRFYEALMCDVVCLFAPNTMKTIQKSGYKINENAILPENCYKQELNEYINSLNYSELVEQQKKLHNDIILEKRNTIKGIIDFLNK